METGYVKSVFGMDTTPAVEGLRKLTGALGTVAGKLGVVGFAFTYFGVRYVSKAIKETIAFQREVAELTKLLGQTEAFPISQAIADMSTRMPLAREELSEVAATAARLGIRGSQNILKFTETMGMMGVATDITSTAAADALARIAKQTKLPISDIDRMASSINELSNTTATSANEIVENMRRMAPEYARMGFSVDQIAALSATMNVVSESATRAGTRLRRLMQEMTSPDKVQAFAAAAGMVPVAFSKMRKEDPTGTLLKVINAVARGTKEGIALANVLDARARLAVIALSQAELDLIENLDLSAQAFRDNVSIQQEYARFLEIMPSQIVLLNNTTRELRRELGEEWLPIAEKMLKLRLQMARGRNRILTDPYFYDLMDPDRAKALERALDGVAQKFGAIRDKARFKGDYNEGLSAIWPGKVIEKDKLEDYLTMQLESLNAFGGEWLDIVTYLLSEGEDISGLVDEVSLKNNLNNIASIFRDVTESLEGDEAKLDQMKVRFGLFIDSVIESGQKMSALDLTKALMSLAGTGIDALEELQRRINGFEVPAGLEEAATRLGDIHTNLANDIARMKAQAADIPWDDMWDTDETIRSARALYAAYQERIAAGDKLTRAERNEYILLNSMIPDIETMIIRRHELSAELEKQRTAQAALNRAEKEAQDRVINYEGELGKLLDEIDELERGTEGLRDSYVRMWTAMGFNPQQVESLMALWDYAQALKEAKDAAEQLETEHEKLYNQWQKKMDDLNLASLQSKFRLMEQVITGIADGFMEFTEAIVTGSGNATEAVVDMIKTIVAELLRSQIMRLLGSLPGFQGLFGISKPTQSGFTTTAIGPGSPVGHYSGYSSPLGGVNFAATPNLQMTPQMQDTVVVNNNFTIQALDSRSVREMLVQERDTITGITVNSIDRSTSLRRRIH